MYPFSFGLNAARQKVRVKRRRVSGFASRPLIAIFAALAFTSVSLSAANPERDVTVHALGRPTLVFACDRPTADLASLFTPAIVAGLVALHAGVALSTEDFSPARAAKVAQLTDAGIPMTAWLVLPKDQGYYVNAANASQAAARFDAFDAWTREHRLRWAAVGLDIEPRLNEFASLEDSRLRMATALTRRAFDGARADEARSAYAALIRRMQGLGYRVETYQLPFIVDARREHTTLLERTLGMVDVRGDEEILMLYTSFNHQTGAGMIWAYGPEAQAIAVGSTAGSGDPATDARMPPLNWDEFSRDLIVAAHFSRTVGVYSLEGCVHQDFLPRLKAFDWTAPVVLSADSIDRAENFRGRVQHVLWLVPRLPYINSVLFALLVVAVVFAVRRRRARKRASAAG